MGKSLTYTYLIFSLGAVVVLICSFLSLLQKYHNDTMGHAAGDKYIIDAALIIKEAFARIGKAYKHGSDKGACRYDDVCEKSDH